MSYGANFGRILAEFWQNFGRILAAFWHNVERMLVVFLFLGFPGSKKQELVLDLREKEHGLTLAQFWQNFGRILVEIKIYAVDFTI